MLGEFVYHIIKIVTLLLSLLFCSIILLYFSLPVLEIFVDFLGLSGPHNVQQGTDLSMTWFCVQF